MRPGLVASRSVELAVTERSGLVETRHLGAALVLAPDGRLRSSLGDIEAPIYPHQALAPFTVLAALEAGADADPECIALGCGDHRGAPEQVAVVREVLATAGLEDAALECPPARALDVGVRDMMVRSGVAASSVYFPGSGTHAFMAAACAARGWSVRGYLDRSHPLQRLVRETVERFASERVAATGEGLDLAPVPALSLEGLGRALVRLATANPSSPFSVFRHAARVGDALRTHPGVRQGPGAPLSRAERELGLVALPGEAGVLAAIARDGTVVAVKVLDGAPKPALIAVLQLLAAADAVDVDACNAVIPALGLELRAEGSSGRVIGAVLTGSGLPLAIE